MERVHIGSVIHEKLKEQRMSVTDFAKALHCNRPNVYSIFERNNIDVELLVDISKVLNCDFLSIYQNSIPKPDYIVLIETNERKIKEIQSDDSIKIMYIQKTTK
ncbi:MAG: helix-turn-helix transcriptional regulator [Dysgonamonadaceae bacterium]|jgi:transcriptional regulator with XRE-family HTH domain|nr:helix-turn-helix transcriptional regulator [Dysgonamonadaceae bacterium]